jgi:hypothetical protein
MKYPSMLEGCLLGYELMTFSHQADPVIRVYAGMIGLAAAVIALAQMLPEAGPVRRVRRSRRRMMRLLFVE